MTTADGMHPTFPGRHSYILIISDLYRVVTEIAEVNTDIARSPSPYPQAHTATHRPVLSWLVSRWSSCREPAGVRAEGCCSGVRGFGSNYHPQYVHTCLWSPSLTSLEDTYEFTLDSWPFTEDNNDPPPPESWPFTEGNYEVPLDSWPFTEDTYEFPLESWPFTEDNYDFPLDVWPFRLLLKITINVPLLVDPLPKIFMNFSLIVDPLLTIIMKFQTTI